MKGFRFIIALTLVLGSAACVSQKEFEERVKAMEERVAALEKQVQSLNNDLRTINLLLSGKYFIESVSAMQDGSGYQLVMTGSDGHSFIQNIYNGKDAQAPVVSVRKDADGQYYWTVNGEWLLENGQKVRANGLTPEFKVENGQWYVRLGSGEWAYAGPAVTESTALIRSVEVDETAGSVLFVMADGSSFEVLMMNAALFFRIDIDDDAFIGMQPGETRAAEYEIVFPEGVTEYSLETFESEGLTVYVTKPVGTRGTVVVSLDANTSSGKLILILNGDNGSNYSKVLKVGVETDSVLQYSVPGLYMASGSARIYVSGSDQYCREWDEDKLNFAIVNPEKNDQLIILGYRKGLNVGDTLPVVVAWEKDKSSIATGAFVCTVLRDEGGKVWLGDSEGNGVIIIK